MKVWLIVASGLLLVAAGGNGQVLGLDGRLRDQSVLDSRVEIRFVAKCESYLPAALASMACR